MSYPQLHIALSRFHITHHITSHITHHNTSHPTSQFTHHHINTMTTSHSPADDIHQLMTVEIFHPKAPAIFYFITCLLSYFNLCNMEGSNFNDVHNFIRKLLLYSILLRVYLVVLISAIWKGAILMMCII